MAEETPADIIGSIQNVETNLSGTMQNVETNLTQQLFNLKENLSKDIPTDRLGAFRSYADISVEDCGKDLHEFNTNMQKKLWDAVIQVVDVSFAPWFNYPNASNNQSAVPIKIGKIFMMMFSDCLDRYPTDEEIKKYGDLDTTKNPHTYTLFKPIQELYTIIAMKRLGYTWNSRGTGTENSDPMTTGIIKDMDGKTVIITGMSRGMGFDMAVIFALRGATVYGCGRSDQTQTGKFGEQICDWFNWCKRCAQFNTDEQLNGLYGDANMQDNLKTVTTEKNEAISEWNVIGINIEDSSGLGGVIKGYAYNTEPILNGNAHETIEYYLPMKYLQFYYGLTNCPPDVLNKINYTTCDIRDASQYKNYMNDFKTATGTYPDHIFLNAATEGEFIGLTNYGQGTDTLESISLNFAPVNQDVIDGSPNATYNIKGYSTPINEYYNGTIGFMQYIKTIYADADDYKKINYNVISSIAGGFTGLPNVPPNSINYSNFPLNGSYVRTYAQTKFNMALLVQDLRTNYGYNIQAWAPGTFTSIINFQFVTALTVANKWPLKMRSWHTLPQSITSVTSPSSDTEYYLCGNNNTAYNFIHSLQNYAAGVYAPPTILNAVITLDTINNTKNLNPDETSYIYTTENLYTGIFMTDADKGSFLPTIDWNEKISDRRDMRKVSSNTFSCLIERLLFPFQSLFVSTQSKMQGYFFPAKAMSQLVLNQ